jgi:DNA replication protein DnaC
VLEAQAEKLAPLDFLSRLVQDELLRREDRLLERRVKLAGFRDAGKRLDTFDFDFNKKMPRALVFALATARWVTQHADALFLGPPELLGDTAAVSAMLDRLLHHAHVLTCGPRSWRTRLHSERSAS